MKLNTHLKNMSIAHVNGHCVELYVNTKSQFHFGIHICHYRDYPLLLWDIDRRGFKAMFADPHLLDNISNAFDDDERPD